MNTEQKRMFASVILAGIILFGWQYFFGAQTTAPTIINENLVTNTDTSKKEVEAKTEIFEDEKQELTFELFNKENSYILNNKLELVNASITSSGVKLKDITGQEKSFIIEFLTGDVYKSKYFSVKESSSTSIVFFNEDGIEVSFSINSLGQLNLYIISAQNIQTRFTYLAKEKSLDDGRFRQFYFYTDTLNDVKVGSDDYGDKMIVWSGLDFDYHLFNMSHKNAKSYLYKITEAGKFTITTSEAFTEFKADITFTKKEYDKLIALGNNQHMAIDFGFWGIVAVPILRGLQMFYSFFNNYGLAIIFLTFLIRLLTFPLQYKSFKSMKKMQTIQPELQKLREKFKDNPQKMQQESMALFKKSGANPLGGCLPLLLQLPVFFAFYKVLYSAVELVNAPFIFWITDLSVKDPYYVLPVLMTLAMFLQQKITPSTSMDPTQQKIMMFMPLIFGVIMKDLPAGLTLYIFVSTVLGMLQQMFVYKRT
jgi:YidC/Oxa1 family membrane protein insertase